MQGQLVLIRHGESAWNKENRFTGWTDVDLTDKGIEQATRAGTLLKDKGFTFDVAYTSMLTRAIRTLWGVLDAMGLMWLPTVSDWQLNDRHYGALQGLNKDDTVAKYGKEQVNQWRRSFDVEPPALDVDDSRHPRFDARYAHLDASQLPATECLASAHQRVIAYWNSDILPQLQAGQRVLIAAHSGSLKCLVGHLDGSTEDVIAGIKIPTGVPLVYDLDIQQQVIKRYYLE